MTPESEIRILSDDDREALLRFLSTHATSSMFLRSNVSQASLVDAGQPLQGTYAALVEGGEIRAVAAHFWNGMLVLQAPQEAVELAWVALEGSERALAGLLGPWAQVQEVQAGLGVDASSVDLQERQTLYTLSLSDLKLPEKLGSGAVQVRRCAPGDIPTLVGWRVDFSREALRAPTDEALEEEARETVLGLHQAGNLFVAAEGGRLVSMAAINARVDETVQIGGVFTPAAWRNAGFGRCAVAGALRAVQGSGVSQAVLFTGDAMQPAQAAYRALGFLETGDYGLVLCSKQPERKAST